MNECVLEVFRHDFMKVLGRDSAMKSACDIIH